MRLLKTSAVLVFAISMLCHAGDGVAPFDPTDWINRADLSDPARYYDDMMALQEQAVKLLRAEPNQPVATLKRTEDGWNFQAVNHPELLRIDNVLDGLLFLLSIDIKDVTAMSYVAKPTVKKMKARGFTEEDFKALSPFLHANAEKGEYALRSLLGKQSEREVEKDPKFFRLTQSLKQGMQLDEHLVREYMSLRMAKEVELTRTAYIEMLESLSHKARAIFLSYGVEVAMNQSKHVVYRTEEKTYFTERLIMSLKRTDQIK